VDFHNLGTVHLNFKMFSIVLVVNSNAMIMRSYKMAANLQYALAEFLVYANLSLWAADSST